jgi:hypothetical protein
MKRVLAVSAILIITLLLFAVFFVNYSAHNTETVFVGVTYCGDSVEEGKMLIDKVKDYTNLFVLQSGILQRDLESVDELGDYAVSAGMYFLPYFGHYIEETFSVWLETAKQRWGAHLLGVYYADEPGGKMLDDYVEFRNTTTGDSIMKTRYGDVVLERSDDVVIHYALDGVIHLYLPSSNQNSNSTDGTETGVYATFYPDGAIKVDESNASAAASQIADLPDYATYEQLSSLRPLKDNHEVADRFITRNQISVEYLSNSTTVFTSDYALYWFDYLAGYDVILAHVGWNHTLNQHIALLRGAARLQNKDWGIVITWKYKSSPYLDTGEEILNQMSTAYECGAKYFVLFNYYDDLNPYGTMKDEHFAALESFWNDVIKNPRVVHGSVKADSVLVLPKNYGWGMRSPEDKIWGIFKPDNKTQTISDLMEHILKEHDLKTDIVYDDPEFPLPPEYQHIYYWNQKYDNN